MALLASGNSGQFNASSVNTSVTVSAGNGNRKLIVGIVFENNATVSAVTFNSQDLVALGLEVSGTEVAPDGNARVVFFEQFEAGLPASGSHTLAVTFSAGVNGVVFWWLVDGRRQDQLATGNSNSVGNAGSAGTSLSLSISAGDAGAFLAAVCYRNDTNGALTLSAPASSTTAADVALTTGGGRAAGGHKDGSLAAGSNTVTWAYSSAGQARRAIAAVVANTAPDTVSVSGDAAAPLAQASGSAQPEQAFADIEFLWLDNSLTNPRNVDTPEGADLLVVAVYGTFISPRSGTYGGQTLSVASTASGFAQLLYLLDPPSGTNQLSLTGEGGGDETFLCLFYSGVASYQSGSGGTDEEWSVNVETDAPGSLIVGIIDSDAGAYTPVTGVTERVDSSGHFAGDRVDASAGTFAIGTGAVSGVPDLTWAVFAPAASAGALEVSGDVAAPLAQASGSAEVAVAASGAATAPLATASGSAEVAVAAFGAAAAPLAQAAGSAEVVVEASGAATAPLATAAGSAAAVGGASGSPSAPLAVAAGSAEVFVTVSGAAQAPLASASGATNFPAETVSGAAAAPLAQASGSAEVAVGASGAATAPLASAEGVASAIVPQLPGTVRVRERPDRLAVVPLADSVDAGEDMLAQKPGTAVWLPIECRSGITGDLTNPTGLTVVVTPDEGDEETYVQGTDSEIETVATGRFRFRLLVPSSGRHVSWRVTATGAVAAVASGTVLIDHS